MSRRGFTLLEVMVALAVLAVALVAILDINAQTVAKHVYAKKLTVATLLARSKMIDLEQKLYDQGLNVDDEEDAGDFGEEGWPSFKWRSKTIAPKTNGLSPEQLFTALLNIPLGDSKDGPAGILGGLFGSGGKSGAKGPSSSPGSSGGSAKDPMALLGAMGPMAGVASQQFTQMIDQLQKSVREVHLTVSWKEGRLTESIDLVTHVVSFGPGSDRNGGPTSGAATYVRPDGTPARQPQPCATGVGMCDADGAILMTPNQSSITK